ncbi:hypothetical protein M5585_16085 [Serratia ureilytica]
MTPNQIRIPATPGKIGAPPVFAAMPPGMPRKPAPMRYVLRSRCIFIR